MAMEVSMNERQQPAGAPATAWAQATAAMERAYPRMKPEQVEAAHALRQLIYVNLVTNSTPADL